jgi:hypothetical protein
MKAEGPAVGFQNLEMINPGANLFFSVVVISEKCPQLGFALGEHDLANCSFEEWYGKTGQPGALKGKCDCRFSPAFDADGLIRR